MASVNAMASINKIDAVNFLLVAAGMAAYIWGVVAITAGIMGFRTPAETVMDEPRTVTYTAKRAETQDPYQKTGAYYPFRIPENGETNYTVVETQTTSRNQPALKRLIRSQVVHTHGRIMYTPTVPNARERDTAIRAYVDDQTHDRLLALAEITKDDDQALIRWARAVPREPTKAVHPPKRAIEIRISTDDTPIRFLKEFGIASALGITLTVASVATNQIDKKRQRNARRRERKQENRQTQPKITS